jgi:hypothetical protein
MGPARRMDGFGRTGAAPQAQPQPRPAAPQARPAAAQPMRPRPVAAAGAMPGQRPVQRPMAAQGYDRAAGPRPGQAPVQQAQPARPAKVRGERKGGGWKVALQFVIGLAVIAGVAFAIVWLYIKYYQ